MYLITNDFGNVMYTGVTNNLERRIIEHRNGTLPGFTQKYKVSKLVYYEHTNSIEAAIMREKQIKKYRREKKDALVNAMNYEWKDLSNDWYSEEEISRERSK